jgi:hypothetical protein
MEQCFSLTANQPQPAYKPKKQSAERAYMLYLISLVFLKESGGRPCIEVRKIEGFASMADTPQQATGQPRALERAIPQRNEKTR